ncbi:MAG: hypothetical protein KGO81_00875 [Bacteroidota bacterium]|nr:hypothetical protein [Bacteroidota bacterium]
MKKIMHVFMLSCKKATELIEKKMIVKLSFRENLQLNLHKTMCDACTVYEKQSKKIDEFLRYQITTEKNDAQISADVESLKKKIIDSIQSEQI